MNCNFNIAVPCIVLLVILNFSNKCVQKQLKIRFPKFVNLHKDLWLRFLVMHIFFLSFLMNDDEFIISDHEAFNALHASVRSDHLVFDKDLSVYEFCILLTCKIFYLLIDIIKKL